MLYARAHPFFRACLAYLFEKKGTSGDSHCRLIRLAAACLGGKRLHACNLFGHVSRLDAETYAAFVTALQYVDSGVPRRRRLFLPWSRAHGVRVKYNAVLFFYRCAERPCNRWIQTQLYDYQRRSKIAKAWDAASFRFDNRQYSWKMLVPKATRVSKSGFLKEISAHLCKVRRGPIHPLVKIAMERFRPAWPLNLALLAPRTPRFISVICNLRHQVDAGVTNVRGTVCRLTTAEKRELKTIVLHHQRSRQFCVFFDKRPKLSLSVPSSQRRSDAHETSSLCVCQFCSTILTYVGLKNRPPVKGVYYDDHTLRFRCGNCHSHSVVKFPLVAFPTRTTYYAEQPDLPAVGVCRAQPACFNLALVTEQECGSC